MCVTRREAPAGDNSFKTVQQKPRDLNNYYRGSCDRRHRENPCSERKRQPRRGTISPYRHHQTISPITRNKHAKLSEDYFWCIRKFHMYLFKKKINLLDLFALFLSWKDFSRSSRPFKPLKLCLDIYVSVVVLKHYNIVPLIYLKLEQFHPPTENYFGYLTSGNEVSLLPNK